MDAGALSALRVIQNGRARDVDRKLASQLQSAGLVQRMNGELCLTAKGAAVLNAGVPDAPL